MPLRVLARAGPLALGALAAAIWVRRRRLERPALASGAPAAGRPGARFVRASEGPAVDIVTVVDDLLDVPR
jgi:hypothetical protein